jgi:DNA-binding HxlR family transcriptional regulator
MAIIDVLSEREMIHFILFLRDSDRKESEFRTIINSHYKVRDMLTELEEIGIAERIMKRERGMWYSLTPKGRRLADDLRASIDRFEKETYEESPRSADSR